MSVTHLTPRIQASAYKTRNPADGLVGLADVIVVEYDKDGGEVVLSASADNPIYVLGLKNAVLTAFSGGTPAIDIGDGTTADKYIAKTAIAETSAGDLASSVTCGLKLTASAKIVATVSGGATAGKGALIVEVLRVKP